MTRTAIAVTVAAALAAATSSVATAQPRKKPKPGTTRGATLKKTIEPPRGFVDDPIAFDGAGGRLLYAHSDAGKLAELQVLDLAQGYADLATIDISKVTTLPIDVHFTLDGEHYLVIYKTGAGDDASKGAALFDRKGKVVRTFGPATDVAYTTYAGKPAVVTFDEARGRDKNGRVTVDYTVEARDLARGKRLGKKTTLSADDTGKVDKLDFRIEGWRDGYTRAEGIKGGTWDRKEDQRSPDQAAVYDLPEREFARIAPIGDPRAHALRVQVRGEHANEDSFVRVERDLTGLQWFDRDGAPKSIEVAQPFHHYDPKSLHYQATPDGGMYFSLAIDPVNPDAVARKKADDKWLDLYRLDPGKTKARRVARLLLGKRDVAWAAADGHWAVLTKHVGFSRGGEALRVYATSP